MLHAAANGCRHRTAAAAAESFPLTLPLPFPAAGATSTGDTGIPMMTGSTGDTGPDPVPALLINEILADPPPANGIGGMF